MLTLEHPLRRFRLPALLVAAAMAYGTIGYMLLEGWDAFDAFYMTITTIATVGYGEVRPLTPVGRAFTMTLIVGGVGTMLYAFGIFAEVLAEGRFAAFRRERRMAHEIGQLRGHYIICGYGRVGTQIAQEFDRQRIPHVIVELNEEPRERARHEGRPLVEGDAASEDVLRAAGIERAKGLLAVTDSDERVVYITLAARSLVPELFIVARAGKPESIRRLELAGASRVISPYVMAGRLMAHIAQRPDVHDPLEALLE